ncbi:MAG: hypothetical protein DMG68_14615 [Acidobacteria bacterium]|nr:MAG: hypothetical protein DMG68_14615 [Acidobacteriota bacterium]
MKNCRVLSASSVEQINTARTEAAEFQEYFVPGSARGEDAAIAFDYDEWDEISAGNVRASLLRQWVCTERYKLKLGCVRANGSLRLELHYDSARYTPAAIEQLGRCLETLLTAAVANPETLASALPLLNEEERQRITVAWNQTAAEYSREQTISALFEQQAVKTPDRAALVCNDQQLTYAELNRRANQLAHHLRKLGVGPDALVGLCVERSTELMVALLGILKAGGAYVPLNPDNPPARMAQQLADARVLITQEKLLGQMPSSFSGPTVCVDRDAEEWAAELESNPMPTAGPENLVYVIYTSGSTGVPKGVAVRHRNLINYSEFICKRLELAKYPEGLNFATVSTIGADLGNTCIYPALISGGTLHLVSYEVATDSRKLAEYQQKNQIDVLKIVPSHLGALLNSEEAARVLPRRYLILGGEALSWGLVDKIRATHAGCEIINHYGPTETTVGSLTLRLAEVPQLSANDSATVPIGRPISNTQVYILDQARQPVPVGVVGELYIGGEGVTAGYLNQPEKTAERFVADPFSKNPNAFLYKTGDLARYLPEGHIEFLGRGDDQVKVRGFRIELGEVEAVLASQAGVKQVAVLARDEKDTGEKRLVAYLVTSRDHPPTTDTLRQKLREQLPEYMVPSALVILDKLPLNANGKVDRQALPSPEEVQEQTRAYVAPRTPIEEVVANIWAEVLHREQVGAEDNFFDLGGHSLLATQIVSRIREHFSIDLALRSLFETPTVAGLAEIIKAAQEAGETTTESATILRVSRDAYRVTRSGS